MPYKPYSITRSFLISNKFVFPVRVRVIETQLYINFSKILRLVVIASVVLAGMVTVVVVVVEGAIVALVVALVAATVVGANVVVVVVVLGCLLYTSPSPRDQRGSRMPSSA